MRILALDLGTKKCGIAISDPLKIISQPLTTIFYDKQDFTFLILEMKQIIEKYQPIEKVVIGFPKNIGNDLSPTAKIVLKFQKIFKTHFPNMPLLLIDESYTTQESIAIMNNMNLSTKAKKQKKDQIAAQKILERYLNKTAK